MDARILLIEDEEHLARGLSFILETDGYQVEVFEHGEGALERLENPREGSVDLIILDVMLPGISGLEVLKHLRESDNRVPVLLLTARDTEQDIVDGLDTGADDYLTKPFSLLVLQARVRTLLRRASPAEDQDAAPSPFQIGDSTVHPDRFELERNGEALPLTAKELGLILLLYERRGSAVSRGDILQEVWGLHPQTQTRVVDTFVLRLRKLIEPDPAHPRHLLSVRAFGYRLAKEESSV